MFFAALTEEASILRFEGRFYLYNHSIHTGFTQPPVIKLISSKGFHFSCLFNLSGLFLLIYGRFRGAENSKLISF